MGRLSRYHQLVLESDTASEQLYMCCLCLNKLVDDFNHCIFDDVCKVINTLRLVFLELRFMNEYDIIDNDVFDYFRGIYFEQYDFNFLFEEISKWVDNIITIYNGGVQIV